MSKNENKTVATKKSVTAFLKAIQDTTKREDSNIIHKMLEKISGENGVMWGESIIGYGNYHYKYDSGREGDFMKIGFSPRKQNIAIYIMTGAGKYSDLNQDLGKYKIGKSCLYIKKLADINLDILTEICTRSYDEMTKKFG